MTKKIQQQPKKLGIRRVKGSISLHKLVKKELKAIAKNERKTFSYVVAEVIYSFFGLHVTKNDVIKLQRVLNFEEKKTAKILNFKRKAS